MKRKHDCQQIVLPQDVWTCLLDGLSVTELYRLATVCQWMLKLLPLVVSKIQFQETDCIKRSLLESFVNLRSINLIRPHGYRARDKSLYQFTMEPMEPLRPVSLQALYVFDNDLIDCPQTVSLLTNLTDLSLSHRTRVCDSDLKPLTNLRRLTLIYPINPIYAKVIPHHINESLTTLTNLQSLSIIGTPYVSCQTLSRLTWLKSLSIRDNILLDCECFEPLVNLTSLDLTFHPVGEFYNPDIIANLPKLKHLTLTNFDAPFMQRLSQLTNPVIR